MDLSRTPARRWFSPLPWGFALLAAVSSLTYGGDHAVNAWASTNLANMGDHPVEALIASTFLFGSHPWACLRSIAFAGAVLAFLVIRFGNIRAVALIAAGQVLGTLVSEGLLAARIEAGQADPALRATLDVGPSYVIVSALAAVVTAGARRWHRWTALAALVMRAPHITSGLTTLGVTPVGHVTALSTGMLLAWGLRSSDGHRYLHRLTPRAAPLQTEGRTNGRVPSVVRPPARRRVTPHDRGCGTGVKLSTPFETHWGASSPTGTAPVPSKDEGCSGK
ncbi:rhomboid-like protein [Streptomyces sp. NPDC091217]|uniref:rhomboid-like protein n=1 Tax=Streptomyces sp. NPDC091217 TaxID=3365975 RepID=UPI003822F1AC